VLAARAALRVLPLLWLANGRYKSGDIEADVVLPVFRAAAVAWAAGKYPAQTIELATFADADRAVAAAAARTAAFAEAAFAAARADAAFAAGRGDAAAVAAATDAASAAVRADAAAAAANATFVAVRAGAAAADSFAADSSAIENGLRGEELAGRKLWPGKRPPQITVLWSGMKKALLAQGDDWEVWTKWYDDRLNGRRSIESLEAARVFIREEIWRQGPKVVNAEIKKLIEEFSPLDQAAEREALRQRPAAFQFRIANGKVDAAPEDAVAIDKDSAEDLYQEAKRKAEALKDRLDRAQADEHLRQNIGRLLNHLGQDSEGLRPGLVLSSVRSLQADVRAYDTDEGRKEVFPDILAKIIDLSETARDLASTFPKSREIEAEAVALDLPMERIDEIEADIVEMAEAIKHSDGATEPAKTAIDETVAAVANSRSLADRAKLLSYSLLDIGNFTRAGLKYLKETGQKIAIPVRHAGQVVGGELAGLGADSWRSMRKGFPKGVERGAQSVGKAMIVGGAASLMGALVHPVAALGALVISYSPFEKIAAELTHRANK
jgi:hypothetical protein